MYGESPLTSPRQTTISLCISNTVIPLFLILTLFNRKWEMIKRIDFQWRYRLNRDVAGVDTTKEINKLLIENILPAYLAQHYLVSSRCFLAASSSSNGAVSDLYSEKYEKIAVMFASIPNYKEFYDENDINKQGLECIRLLNEIICDFDKLLSKPKFSVLEKIKTIGSTYMVASGLQPGQESESTRVAREKHLCSILVDFFIQLRTLLDQINQDSFQRFQLRGGMSHGCVVAGVVGSQKPQYDIWGNTVNVASRMESTGEDGRLQVPEHTADVLKKAQHTLICRGPIHVKGKGLLTTYFVKTAFDDKKPHKPLDLEYHRA